MSNITMLYSDDRINYAQPIDTRLRQIADLLHIEAQARCEGSGLNVIAWMAAEIEQVARELALPLEIDHSGPTLIK